MTNKTSKIALISVFDKEKVVYFAKTLQRKFGYKLISTGKTQDLLSKEGLVVEKISDVTKSPEILGGRVKTLHPKIFGGILADLKPRTQKGISKILCRPNFYCCS